MMLIVVNVLTLSLRAQVFATHAESMAVQQVQVEHQQHCVHAQQQILGHLQLLTRRHHQQMGVHAPPHNTLIQEFATNVDLFLAVLHRTRHYVLVQLMN